MPKYLKIAAALNKALPIIDVRSPGEFEKGHIVGAVNIPLFNNDERAKVGTVYVQESKERAVELGYKLVTPKLQWFVEESQKAAPNSKVIVHCWRGGMRSASFAEHLEKNGFKEVYVIEGGYKAFRNHVLDFFEKRFDLKILGGYTGSGKTPTLIAMSRLDFQVIDLEGLANHKGSAFGAIGQKNQPSVEHFENILFQKMKKFDLSKPIWMEDESHNIGMVKLPIALFRQIRTAPLFFVDIPKNERTNHLVPEYTRCNPEQLIAATLRIGKRLGGQFVQQAIEDIEKNRFAEAALTILRYYDKYYLKGMKRRDPSSVISLNVNQVNPEKIARLVIEKYKEHEQNKTYAV